MASKDREREHARKRYERWLAHQQELRERQRRRRKVAIVAMVLIALGLGGTALAAALLPDDAAPSPTPTSTPTPTVAAPDPALAENRTWTVTLNTTAGELVLELDGQAAPQAVASFVTLAQEGFFDGTTCHRLTTAGIFVLQCGDPTGTGTGGPAYRFGPIENAPADAVYPAGTVAMARVGGDPNSMGSQFFLVHADSTIPPDSAGGYTVFGRIVSGMDVLTAVAEAGIAEGTAQTPALEVTIEGVEIE